MATGPTCCNDFSRTELLRRAAAGAGAGLPAIEAGMPLPAGTGLDRRSFLLRSRRRSRSPSTAATLLGLRALEDGIASGRRRPASRSSSRSSSRRRRLALDARARPATRSTAAAPDARAAARPATPFAEDARLRWHPSPPRSPRCTARAR